MGFSRHEYWSGLPFPSPGDLPDSGIEPRSPASADRIFTTEPLVSLLAPKLNPKSPEGMSGHIMSIPDAQSIKEIRPIKTKY